jgi:chromosome partitioning protein
MPEEEISLKDAALRFGVKLDRLRRAAWDGRLRARLLGHQYLVRPSEVERFLEVKERALAPSEAATWQEGATMARIIAVTMPKGGTSKTTTTLNLGAALVEAGQRVLLVDFDPQASLTIALGFEPDTLDQTVYSAIKYYVTTYESHVAPAILQTATGADLLPCNTLLNLANEELVVAVQREFILRKLLEPVQQHYDFILIDTLPYLGVLVINALVAADEVLIPLQAEFLATPSVDLILKQIDLVRRSGLNPRLAICGILMTMVRERTIMSRETMAYARRHFTPDAPVFATHIKETASISHSQAARQSILQYEPRGDAARAYRALAQEVLGAAAT